MANRSSPDQLALGFAPLPEPAVAREAAPARTPTKVTQLDKNIDWFQVITDLGRHGYSAKAISDHLKIPKSTLLGWKQGAEPRYREGRRLVAFWCEITGKTQARLPMVDISCWWSCHAK